MPTVTGGRPTSTALCGFRAASPPTGRRTAAASGSGLRPGGGPGSDVKPGALHLSIMGVGHVSTVFGPGFRVPGAYAPFTHRPWSYGERHHRVLSRLTIVLRPGPAGRRWPRATPTYLTIGRAAVTSSESTRRSSYRTRAVTPSRLAIGMPFVALLLCRPRRQPGWKE